MMAFRQLILIITLILPVVGQAKVLSKLQTGDLLLQPLDCWACDLIEGEENTIFSHVGIFARYKGKAVVLEALGKVKMTPLKKFLERTQKDQKVLVVRHREVRAKDSFRIVDRFVDEYLGLEYDEAFLWNNVDELGRPKLYCSELGLLLLNPFVSQKFVTKKMHFDFRPEDWDRYFNGKTPRDHPGISPADMHRHPAVRIIGEL
jgi:hypothetical protein